MDNPYQSPNTDPQNPAVQAQSSKLTWKQILFSFSGRIPRRIYWGATLLSTIVFYAIFGIVFGLDENAEPSTIGVIVVLISLIPMIWINLAVAVKRWHDRGKSGAMVLIGFIPLIGPIWTFVECGCLRGTLGPNQHGPDST